MHQHLNFRGLRRRRREKKGYEKNFEEIIVGNFPNIGKEIVNQVQEAQSPIQDKSKEKYTKRHTNQINKDLEELKNKYTGTNNAITEIKHTLEGTNSRISEAEE